MKKEINKHQLNMGTVTGTKKDGAKNMNTMDKQKKTINRIKLISTVFIITYLMVAIIIIILGIIAYLNLKSIPVIETWEQFKESTYYEHFTPEQYESIAYFMFVTNRTSTKIMLPIKVISFVMFIGIMAIIINQIIKFFKNMNKRIAQLEHKVNMTEDEDTKC